MKIGFITPGFSADEQDWCIPALLNLARILAHDHEVHLFTLRYPHRRDTYQVAGATVHAFGGATAGGLWRGPLLARAIAALVAEHRRGPFDLLHALWADEPGAVAVLASRLLGIPPIVSLLGGELVGMADIGYGVQLSRSGRTLTRLALHGATLVTVGSETFQAHASRTVPAARLRLMPLGVDTGRFTPDPAAPKLPGHPALLHVASLVPIKDQGTLLHALARIVARWPLAHLHLVGSGPCRPMLQALAHSLGIEAHLTFHGEVAHHDLPTLYRAADLHLLSSRFESQGMVVLEAGAAGRGTIGTAVGLLPELGSAARTVPVGDAPALADALLDTLAAPGGPEALGQVALEVVRARYSLEAMRDTILALYAEALTGRARSQGEPPAGHNPVSGPGDERPL